MQYGKAAKLVHPTNRKGPSTPLRMRTPNAVCLFAEAVENEYARWYATIRQTLPKSERRARDTAFLCGRGGDTIRDAWRDIGPDERERLIQATPDSSFPNDTYGIMDEHKKTTAKMNTAKKTTAKTKPTTIKMGKAKTKRSKLYGSTQKHFQPIPTIKPKRVRYSNRVTDEPMSPLPVQHDSQLQTRIAEMERARNEYYTVLSKEQDLRIYAAYNGENMVGIIEAAVTGAQNTVVLPRIKDKPKTVEDAFSAVALRLDDVLAVLTGTSQFEPDPGYEQPDPRFSVARIRRAKQPYDDTKSALDKLCVEIGADEPADIVIGNRTGRLFGKV
ncbi:hypothetical protein PF005_g12041 [Phytophthora fragariae]|uniref:Uncharacterized protein n=1 Tax=Phytophthora fragariae TaxID=53985 RepID=A0A6A4DPZ0_9STRA|nr:hypothetical protein PF003_g39682 [Phytophthora fragariae]KAE8936859.1 hypothetical protein PF009_g13226 [Phytophthora fragariae]KAE9007830.1 hypothetical protein PF011_g10961 [Phytophthora fragariae]KAE9095194.1 hypothetical protein PF006_g24076 [Phytophthora fragariae]KAE9101625.1 hypothetical protein PF010_g14387 [Phytophthora fragariae]